MSELVIKNLHVEVASKEILKGVDLSLKEGETLALLGPNGHGKSTLLAAIMGNPAYKVTEGSILLDGDDVLKMSVDARSKAGVFLAMQYPSEIPGLNSADFLKAAMNAHREKPMSLFEFYASLQTAYKAMGIPFEMSKRNLNEGFSGGEKKRNEMLQMKLLKPKFAMLDEIDSGLDVDAMVVVAKAIEEEQKRGAGFLVVSHYARLYNMIKPTRAAVLINGRIAVNGGVELIEKIDTEGYEWIKRDLGIEVEKETDVPMNTVSIGACATRIAVNDKK
ncbi:MAG: Fe-S cluster assembly ATPase SufC [Bacilli bacterium]|jgi:Fe-S cluster assembly ATP-binding protein|nr:Fe-S cluster assembly ATPase SufC [Bacilli bacterium]MCH4210840.1 Fe-S cluster assembly ATPase SufC [Bacilli bacterium]MCH4228934.1 Fe-S cluster assembly ATPase SufC [Bacilli bacterium]MCH4277754.1 Fe-S cluster assembly ATPase SufC [Bacilli bacterium]MCI2055002.1 Fe-S cluster assembly ATPase SufC [Bacilli bacterium]